MKPLQGIRIVELAATGPVPWCGMLLADMGADVIRVDRLAQGSDRNPALAKYEITDRGCRRIRVDLKSAGGVAAVLQLVARADALIEGMRPGVVERLGLGPQDCFEVNPRLVFGRMTGWGQHGPLAQRAGHDINYIALSGALHAIGPADGAPVPPLNLVGDYGGGGAFLAIGLLAALLRARSTGVGQVIDVAMVDGIATLLALQHGRHAAGLWRDARASNVIDGGAPWYSVYETADGRHMAVGAIEPAFYEQFILGLGLAAAALPDRRDRQRWPELRRRFAAAFMGRTRDAWERRFEGTDACVTPVLSLAEAPHHPHHAARGTFMDVDGVLQPAPAPRFHAARDGPPVTPAREPTASAALADWSLASGEIAELLALDGVAGS